MLGTNPYTKNQSAAIGFRYNNRQVFRTSEDLPDRVNVILTK